jgi:hypothetical protein
MRRPDPTQYPQAKAWQRAPITWPREAFIPRGTPYLGQAVLGEPVRQINVLSPNRSDQ